MSWNRSRSPETTSTGASWVTDRVPSTSSASYPAAPTTVMPTAASTSRIIGTCGVRVSGTTSPPSGASRCALYDGSSATRHSGRQSWSIAQTIRSGRRVRISVASMSRKPRTALTGVPSSAFATDSGMPK